MPKFSFKKIGDEKISLGELLIKSRASQNLEKIANDLDIRKEYLLALEEGEYELLPEGIFSRQFLKKYCQYLKINYSKALALSPFAEDEEEKNPFSKKILRRSQLIVFPKIIRAILLLIFISVSLLYLLLYFQKLRTAPYLEIYAPVEDFRTDDPKLLIRGKSIPEVEIRINNELIVGKEDGSFSREVFLKDGLNTFLISAKKKYSKTRSIERKILLKKYE